MSDDLQAWLRERADASLPSVGSKLRCAAFRLDEQEKALAELERERDEWKRKYEALAAVKCASLERAVSILWASSFQGH